MGINSFGSVFKQAQKIQEEFTKAQEELVEKQLITARIQGMAAIVQGRYEYAAAYGHNASNYVGPAEDAEKTLLKFIEKAGFSKISLRVNIK